MSGGYLYISQILYIYIYIHTYLHVWMSPGHHSLVTGERFCHHPLGSEAVAPTAAGWSGDPAARWRLPIGLIPRWCPEDS